MDDEHTFSDPGSFSKLNPLPFSKDASILPLAEHSCRRGKRHQGHRRLPAFCRRRRNEPEYSSKSGHCPVSCSCKPAVVVLHFGSQIRRSKIARKAPEMTRHGVLIIKLVRGNLDDFPAMPAKPVADQTVFGCGSGITMDVATHPVQVDSDAFIGVVIRRAVDDIRGGSADRCIQTNLLASHALLEPGCEQQSSQPLLGRVDRITAVVRFPRWLLRGNGVHRSKRAAPCIDELYRLVSIQILVVEAIPERLEAVDT